MRRQLPKRKGSSEKRELFSVCRYCGALPDFMNNTIKPSNSATEILQVSKCLKNGTFFRKKESRGIRSLDINLCLRDKDTDDRGVDH